MIISRNHGFTYIGILIFIAVMGIALLGASEVSRIALKRDREKELLFAGDAFRNAINMYYKKSQGLGGRYPQELDDLLKDPRLPNTERYLRKIYEDPMTRSDDWGLVKGPGGEIFGVYSKSDEEPMKKKNFRLADKNFEGKKKYSDWVFMADVGQAPQQQPSQVPGGKP